VPCSTSPRVQPCRVIVLHCICVQEMATRKTDTKLLQLLASALDTEFTNGDETECFPGCGASVLDTALTQLDIKSLLPLNAQHVGIAELSDVLFRGDHIVVRSTGSNAVFHHGIYIGLYTPQDATKPKRYVVDMLGTSLRLRTMEEFIRTKGFPELAVIRYSNDTLSARDRSASLALSTLHELHDCTGLYHLLGDNCNNFATWCRTMRWETADVAAAGAQAYAATCRLQPLKTPLSKTLFLGCAPMHS
jgi:hypothetical protein